MSELLLKGATMTNAHCGECGDPIFRYDGEEFCPTCQRPVADGEDAGGSDDGSGDAGEDRPDAGAGDGDAIADAGASADGPATANEVSAPEDPVDSGAGTFPASASADAGGSTHERSAGTPASPDASDRSRPPAANATGRVRGGDEAAAPADASGRSEGADLDAARASLTRTVARLARQAEASDDLGRTREYLAATREAAEALAAVQNV
jgi:uncharacterized Zn finger protein (UPF0148 family)